MTALGMSAVISYVMIGAGGTFALGLPTVMYFIVLGAFWGLVYLFRISSLEAMAAAIQPWHAGLGLLSVSVLVVMAVYGLVTPRGDSAELGTEGGRRSVVENIDPSLSRREQSAERKWLFRLLFPELRGYHGGNWVRRLQLWQAAGSTGPLTPLIVVGGYISLPHVISDAALHPQSQFTLAIFVVSLLVAMNVYQRPEWFSVEWLRPVSRQTAVGDFLRGIAWDLLGIPLIVLVALVRHLLVDGASLSGAEWRAPILAGTAIYVLCVGVVSLLTLRGLDVMLGGLLLLLLLPIAPLVISFGPPERQVVSAVVLIAIELGMILTGVSLIALARHRWLHRELK